MRKNFVPEWREELKRMKAGLSAVEECTGKEAFEEEPDNEGGVIIRVSTSTYTRLSKQAKRAKLSITEFLEKLAKE